MCLRNWVKKLNEYKGLSGNWNKKCSVSSFLLNFRLTHELLYLSSCLMYSLLMNILLVSFRSLRGASKVISVVILYYQSCFRSLPGIENKNTSFDFFLMICNKITTSSKSTAPPKSIHRLITSRLPTPSSLYFSVEGRSINDVTRGGGREGRKLWHLVTGGRGCLSNTPVTSQNEKNFS